MKVLSWHIFKVNGSGNISCVFDMSEAWYPLVGYHASSAGREEEQYVTER
jgi:hypothetical protein